MCVGQVLVLVLVHLDLFHSQHEALPDVEECLLLLLGVFVGLLG